jgi:hypothetical protein
MDGNYNKKLLVVMMVLIIYNPYTSNGGSSS